MRTRWWLSSFVVLLLGSAARGQPTYTITQVGLTGAPYTTTLEGATIRYSDPVAMSPAGDVTGISTRYGTGISQDSWLFNGQNTVQIGLVGSVYTETFAGNVIEYSVPDAVNDLGEAVGYSYRGGDADTLGQDAWLYNGSTTVQVGYTGAGYSYHSNTFNGTFENSTVAGLDDSGYAYGTTSRYTSSASSLGTDAWRSNGTLIQQIGLVGTGYTYGTSAITESSAITAVTLSGDAIGTSNRYNSGGRAGGQDAWIYANGVITEIGLTGGAYSYTLGGEISENVTPTAINSAGDVVGYSNRFDSQGFALGADPWVYNGSSTQEVGLINGPYSYVTSTGGTHRQSNVIQMNNNGAVTGTSQRYSSSGGVLGQDAWYYSGGTTQQIGLTGSQYSYATTGGQYEYIEPFAMNNTGGVIGSSGRYDASGDNLGADAWYFNGHTTQQLGLTGPKYQTQMSGGMYEWSEASFINDSGDVVGDSEESNQTFDPWFFDPATDTTTPLIFSDGPYDTPTIVEALTNTGVVLGKYDLYQGGVDDGYRAFAWSESTGFEDLGSLVNGGLSAAGWKYLSDISSVQGSVAGTVSDGWPQYVLGDGLAANQGTSTDSSSEPSNDLYFLSATVPEPARTALLGVSMLLALRRRPRP